MGGLPGRIENPRLQTRDQRVAAVSCQLDHIALADHTKSGKARIAEISQSVLGGNGALLHRFEKDSQVRLALYNEGVRNVFGATSQQRFVRELVGGVLAAVAMPLVVATEAQNGNTVIDGPTTLEIMKTLHPNAEEIHDAFGGTSLRGISVPDFLVVSKSGRIVKVGEFKSSLREHGDRSLKTQFMHERDSFQKFPELTKQGGPDLLVVTPHIREEDIPLYLTEDTRISHLQLPFNGGKLRDVVDDLLYKYRPQPEDPTLEEIWNERKFQEARGRESLIVFSPHAVPTTTEMAELARAGVVFDPEKLLEERRLIDAIEAELLSLQDSSSVADAA